LPKGDLHNLLSKELRGTETKTGLSRGGRGKKRRRAPIGDKGRSHPVFRSARKRDDVR